MRPIVQKGSVYLYRVFDIGEEVNLAKVELILSQKFGEARVKIAGQSKDAVVVRNAPLRLSLGEIDFQLPHSFFSKLEVAATLWDYGALSISLQRKLSEPLSWGELVSLAAYMNNDAQFLERIEDFARARAKEVSNTILDAITRPSLWSVSEDYIIYFLEEVEGAAKATDLLDKVDLPRLLLGESKEVISEFMRESILQNLFQYAENDFVLIDWNSAVVLEPTGQRDIPDVLEFALTHLLEVRYYDELLDLRLTELYDSVEEGRGRLFQNRFATISKEANTRFIEFSEVMERMGNSLKVVGDFYFARIFRGAIRRFRIGDWEENITRKMNLLARVSELLQGENNVRRSHLMEIIVILLILFELLTAMFHLHH